MPPAARRRVIAVWLAAPPAWAAASAAASAPAAGGERLVSDYIAGRDAQAMRDFPAAADWYEKAMALDPAHARADQPHLLMEQ